MSPALLVVSLALAQDAAIPTDYPIDVQRFRPAMDPFGYAVTESSTTLQHLQVGAGFWGMYAQDELVLLWDGERVIGPGPDFPDALIDERSAVDLQAGFGLGDIFSFSLDMPIVTWQKGFEPTDPTSPEPTTELLASSIGDLRLMPKFVIVDIHKGYPVGLAVMAKATLPTGERRSFVGEGDPTVTPLAALEVADGSVRAREYRVRMAVNAGARVKPRDSFRGLDLGTEFVYAAGIAAHPAPAVELGADVVGSVAGRRVAQTPIEILPWLEILPVPFVTIGGGAGFGLAPGLGSPDLRVFGGATIAPAFDPLSLDRDKDGVPNKLDQCINIPEDLDGFEDDDGCPDEDNDKDTILDVNDRCPNDPEDFDDYQDRDGCPDPDNDRDTILDIVDSCPNDPEDFDGWQDLDGCPEPDNDGDGLLDAADACPNAAETFNGFQDEDGCPDDKPFVDTDGDGIEDDRDGCPTEPEDFDTWQDDDGCPDVDNDLDGIFDTLDQCPFDAETQNGYLDEDGCPDDAPARVVVERARIRIDDRIYFEVDKAVIQLLSFELLHQIAAAIVENPDITRLRIEGHTDSDGPDAYNLRLSQARAEAVRAFLIEAGVEAGRLDAVGYGEQMPIDTNKTWEGRQANRRVEFVIVERSGG
jgi:outer membrane protein OmpA-like peptidoglycan-associated protein